MKGFGKGTTLSSRVLPAHVSTAFDRSISGWSAAEAYSDDGELNHESANSELAQIQEQAREEGFSKGYADGVAKAAEHADKLASVTALLQTLNQSASWNVMTSRGIDRPGLNHRSGVVAR